MKKTATPLAFVLALFLAAPLAAQEGNREIRRKIETMRISVDFEDASLKEVVQYIREVADINILIGRDIDPSDTVNFQAKDVTIKTFLEFILQPYDNTFVINEEILWIVTRDHQLVRDRVKLRVYDIQDMLYRLPDFPGGEITFGDAGIQIVQQPSQPQPDISDTIVELLMTFTGGSRIWDEIEGSDMILQNGMLIVRQIPEIHAKLERLLSQLRRVD